MKHLMHICTLSPCDTATSHLSVFGKNWQVFFLFLKHYLGTGNIKNSSAQDKTQTIPILSSIHVHSAKLKSPFKIKAFVNVTGQKQV